MVQPITKPDSPDHTKRIVLAIVLTFYCVSFAYILTRQPLILVRSDHFSRWYAARMLFMEGRSLYDPKNGKEVVAMNTIPVDPIEGSFFYPAHLLLLIAPQVYLPYPIAHFLWVCLIQFFLISGLWLASSLTQWPRSTNFTTLLLFGSLFFIPNIQNTIWGQFGTINVISLALILSALYKKKYALAGIWSIGLTFKPQLMLLTLVFLLFWSLANRSRWRFWLSFGLAALACWGIAEWLEPNWLASFWQGLEAYSAHHHTVSVLSNLLDASHIFEALLILATFCVWIYQRRSTPDSPAFAGCLVLSLATWWLVVPVLGMMHLVALPLALVLLFAHLKTYSPRFYGVGRVVFLIVYLLGLAGFLYGFSGPELYGLHIQLAELAYKLIAPILLILLAMPLVLKKDLPANPFQ